jgi:hypothetical protein
MIEGALEFLVLQILPLDRLLHQKHAVSRSSLVFPIFSIWFSVYDLEFASHLFTKIRCHGSFRIDRPQT